MAVCGIYKITNKETGQCYIGQSIDIFKRYRQHLSDKNYKEDDWHWELQHEPEKYKFEILTQCAPEDLDDMESYYIHQFNAYNEGYNKTRGNHSVFKSSPLFDLESSNIEIEQEEIINKAIFLPDENIISNNINNLNTLCINPIIILNNCKELTSMDEDVLIFILYCIQYNTQPRAVDFVHLFNKCYDGKYWRHYEDSYNKLFKLKLIYNDKNQNLNSIILNSSIYNIDLNIKDYIKLKTKPNRYSLLIICLLEYTIKINKSTVSLEDCSFGASYGFTMLKSRVLLPAIKLLNQYYYNNSLQLQFLKENRQYTKVKFIL